jgi:hypothetical protein
VSDRQRFGASHAQSGNNPRRKWILNLVSASYARLKLRGFHVAILNDFRIARISDGTPDRHPHWQGVFMAQWERISKLCPSNGTCSNPKVRVADNTSRIVTTNLFFGQRICGPVARQSPTACSCRILVNRVLPLTLTFVMCPSRRRCPLDSSNGTSPR